MKSLLRRLSFNLLYLSKPPWDSGVSPPELLDFIQAHPPGNAIDLGCGTGTNVLTLAQAGWQVTGVDFIPKAIRAARKKAKQAGIKADLRQADATDLKEIQGPFDLALDMGCFHGLGDNKAKYISELDRVLAPGGYWLMYGFYKSDPLQPGTGLIEADLELIPSSMSRIWRQNGFDSGERTSAWFLYQKSVS
jgi:SAM-dependent methyltransferase